MAWNYKQGPSTLDEAVRTLWFAVFGINGENGLRGSAKQTGNRLSDLEKFRDQMVMGFKVARWVATISGTLLAVAASGPLGQALAKLLGLVGGH